MKIKRIKTEKQLVAVQYIRAVINCHGRFWTEYLILTGKPFNSTSKHMPGHRKIRNKTPQRKLRTYEGEWFVSSLGVGNKLDPLRHSLDQVFPKGYELSRGCDYAQGVRGKIYWSNGVA